MGIAASVDGLIAEVLETFERHGLRYRDDEHTRRAIGLVREAALAYDAQPERSAANRVRNQCLTTGQQRLLAEMCEDARLCVTTGIETCQRCDRHVCRAHVRALDRAESYSSLARQLGAQITP